MIAALSACGANASTPLVVENIALEKMPAETMQADKTFFIPGESMTFELSLRGVVGGSASIAVGQPGVIDGKSVIIVRSSVESAGVVAAIKRVKDEIETLIDVETGTIINHEADSTFGDKQAFITSKFNHGKPGAFHLDYQRKGNKKLDIVQQLPSDAIAFDIHSILGMIRSMDTVIGQEESFFLLSGRRLWRNTLRMGGRENIRTATGRFPTIRFDGVGQRVTRGLNDLKKKKPRNYSIWMTDDGSRLPLLVLVKTEYGDLRVELTHYARPDQRLTLHRK